MNPYALCFVVFLGVLLGGTGLGWLILYVGDLPSQRRRVLTHAIAFAAGFAACAFALVLRA